MTEKHTWQFAARFRRGAFGWKSQPAVKRVKEATSEIKKVARRDPVLAAEGAVRFLEKVSPALEHVDSSSGSHRNAVNKAIEALVPIIAEAPLDEKTASCPAGTPLGGLSGRRHPLHRDRGGLLGRALCLAGAGLGVG